MSQVVATGIRDNVTKEYRVAVVMYGGISLAIYMNGIAQELLAMVRSTAVKARNQPGGSELEDVQGTDVIYRDLARLLSDEGDGGVHVRFVIDIISGTSAGGINGVFLAKALTHRKDMQSLKRTWVEEGDFQRLLNDQTRDDISLPKQVPPRSLLSGERMYVKLFEAFAEMDAAPVEESYVEGLELSVTTTDLLGKVQPLSLADRVVWERRYKQVFRLRYAESEDPKVDDFKQENTPFLAFAARCTSSFPVAFEPMQLASIPRLVRASWKAGKNYLASDAEWAELFAKWQPFFGPADPLSPDQDRFYADGGYLDNRPFDHAIESLNNQSSSVRGERKLLYIEPSPEHPERERKDEDKNGKLIQPDAIENAWDGLASIPGKQPIRDSLLQIQQRNRLIRKVNNVITEISASVARSPVTLDAQAKLGRTVDRSAGDVRRDDLLEGRPGLQAYLTLKVYTVTDDLAVRIARLITTAGLLNIDDDSDYVYAIRCLIKEWRAKAYENNDGQFLLDFDISYRMRRYQFVISQLQLLTRKSVDATDRLVSLNLPANEMDKVAFQAEVERVRMVLRDGFLRIRQASQLAAKSKDLIAKIQELGISEDHLKWILGVDARNCGPGLAPMPVYDTGSPEDRARLLLTAERQKTLQDLRVAVTAHYGAEMSKARDDVSKVLGNDATDNVVINAARLYFFGFEEFDAAVFPITYGTDAGELIPVDVVRVSPEDAIAIQDESRTGRPKLAGASFGAFGAFLERVWRTNDILWGRLDGAERIIRALGGQRPEADLLIERAHNQIISEELRPADRQEICEMLVDALLRTDDDGTAAAEHAQLTIGQIEECVGALKGSTDINPKLLAVLRDALTPDELRFALKNFEISRTPNRKNTLESVARSTRIIGQILDDIASKRPAGKKLGGVLVQAGNVLWGLVEVATPGSIWGSFFSYWFGLFILFAVVMIVGGTLFSEPVQMLGVRLIILALATRLAVSLLRTYIAGSHRWKRVVEAVFISVLLVLLVLGLVEAENLYEKIPSPLLGR